MYCFLLLQLLVFLLEFLVHIEAWRAGDEERGHGAAGVGAWIKTMGSFWGARTHIKRYLMSDVNFSFSQCHLIEEAIFQGCYCTFLIA
jgi:hypothetical protein